MDRFVYLDHTADVKFQAFGRTLEEAFSNCVLATTSVIVDYKEVKKELRKDINIESRNLEALLYDMLDELVFLLDTEFFLASEVIDMAITKENIKGQERFKLSATLIGDDCRRYKYSGDIKSATYNFMFIKEEDGLFTVQAVLDL